MTGMQPTAASETFPNGTEPTHPRALPMTRARRVALALGVPACLALTAWGAFAIVGEIGQGHFPVSDTIPVSGGRATAHVDGGNVALEQGAVGQAKLTGTAHYSLIRPTFTAQRVGSGVAFGYNCDLPVGNCSLDATVTVPAGTATTTSTDGGDATVTGTTGDVTLSSGGGQRDRQSHGRRPHPHHRRRRHQRHRAHCRRRHGRHRRRERQDRVRHRPRQRPHHQRRRQHTIIVPRGTTQYNVNASSAGGAVSDSLSVNTSSPHTITATTGGGNIILREAP